MCWHEAHRKQTYSCAAGCGRAVSGAGRACHPCAAERTRQRKESQGHRKLPAVVAESWWIGTARPAWGVLVAAQMPRFQAAGIGKDRAPIGMSLATY